MGKGRGTPSPEAAVQRMVSVLGRRTTGVAVPLHAVLSSTSSTPGGVANLPYSPPALPSFRSVSVRHRPVSMSRSLALGSPSTHTHGPRLRVTHGLGTSSSSDDDEHHSDAGSDSDFPMIPASPRTTTMTMTTTAAAAAVVVGHTRSESSLLGIGMDNNDNDDNDDDYGGDTHGARVGGATGATTGSRRRGGHSHKARAHVDSPGRALLRPVTPLQTRCPRRTRPRMAGRSLGFGAHRTQRQGSTSSQASTVDPMGAAAASRQQGAPSSPILPSSRRLKATHSSRKRGKRDTHKAGKAGGGGSGGGGGGGVSNRGRARPSTAGSRRSFSDSALIEQRVEERDSTSARGGDGDGGGGGGGALFVQRPMFSPREPTGDDRPSAPFIHTLRVRLSIHMPHATRLWCGVADHRQGRCTFFLFPWPYR